RVEADRVARGVAQGAGAANAGANGQAGLRATRPGCRGSAGSGPTSIPARGTRTHTCSDIAPRPETVRPRGRAGAGPRCPDGRPGDARAPNAGCGGQRVGIDGVGLARSSG